MSECGATITTVDGERVCILPDGHATAITDDFGDRLHLADTGEQWTSVFD